MPVSEFDAVVIGAGHNGLVAANFLVDAGLSVVVVEAAPYVGGMAGSGPIIPGAPNHIANHCAVDPIFWDLFPVGRHMPLEPFGLQVIPIDPAAVYLDSDGASLAFWTDPHRTAAEIRRFSPADADAYPDFVELLRGFVDFAVWLSALNPVRPELRSLTTGVGPAWRHRRRLAEITHLSLASVDDVVGERFTHPLIRDALSVIGGVTSPTHQAGTAPALITVPSFHRPCWRPVGGTGAIPRALARRLGERGSSIRTGTPVEKIELDNGRATAVRLGDGTLLRARRAVLSTCDPRTTLERLVPHGALAPRLERRVGQIPTNAAGYGHVKIDVALSGRIDVGRHQRERTDGLDLRVPSHLVGTRAGLCRAFGRAGAGLLPEAGDCSFWNCISSGADPSMAPAGGDTLYLYSPTAPAWPEGGWDRLIDGAADMLVKQAGEFYGGLTELEVGRRVQTNDTLARTGGVTGGQIAHVDFLPSRIGPLRPAKGLAGYRTPIDGLYLGGAGCHPGGGVTGMPGYLAARTILRDRQRTSRS
jgi:phytoene dehydrogenase-like protein